VTRPMRGMPLGLVLWLPLVPLAVGVAAVAGCSSNGGSDGEASRVVVVAGDSQQTTVGTAVATAPAVRISDGAGTPIRGVVVRFSIPTGSGTVLGDSALSDANGKATVGEWILGTQPGSNTLLAQVAGTSLTASVSAVGLAGGGVSLVASGQQGYVGLAGTLVSPAPTVTVLDSYHNPVAGAGVTFSVGLGNGTITGESAITDARGVAAVGSWKLGPTPGPNTLLARISTGQTIVIPGQAVTTAPLLTAASATTQSGYLSYPVNSIPRVRVTDQAGNPLSGVPVNFTVSSGGGTLAGGASVSDSLGFAAPGDWRIGTTAAVVTAATTLGSARVAFSADGIPAAFTIDLRFVSALTPDVRDAFIAAATRWMQIITAHLTPVSVTLPAAACSDLQPAMSEQVTDVVIYADVVPIDGIDGVLGSASPCAVRSGAGLPAVGEMEFDIADVQSLVATHQLVPTITHEMGHVLGFGTLWSSRSLTSGTGTNDPIFTGQHTVDLWAPFGLAFGYAGRPNPLENTGGVGTRDSHWRESIFHAELMTGFIELPGVFMPLSRLTIGTMEDLGYQVDYTKADAFANNILASGTTFGTPTPLTERLGAPRYQVDPIGTRRVR
jgi:hypothetical protein